MRDAIELEWEGIPTVAVIADALVGAADSMKRISSMPDYRYVVTPFPVSYLSGTQLEERARLMISEVMRLFRDRPTKDSASSP